MRKATIARTLLCLCMILIPLGLSAQGRKVTLSLKDVNLTSALRQVEQQSGYYKINYPSSEVSRYKVNTNVKNATAPEAVKTLLKGLPFESSVNGQFIQIKKTNRQEIPSRKVVRGRILDAQGEPLIGVTVQVEGTQKGAITDIDGNYELDDVEEGEQLTYSYVGKRPLKRRASYKPSVIILEDMESSVGDIVVIGYGSKDKKSLTSSISSLKSEDVERLAPTSTSFDNLLSGTIKGVLSSESSGEPGATVNLNIRGITTPYPNSTSFDSNNVPLFVIDGVAQFISSNALNPLLSLSPNDIESIDILKDASATAIYGSRGANGVIIVKTRNGRKGDKVVVEAGYNLSVGNATKSYKPLNKAEFKTLQDEILSNTTQYNTDVNWGFLDFSLYDMITPLGNFDVTFDEWGLMYLNGYLGLNEDGFGNYDTNWVKEVENSNAMTHRYNASVRGGSEVTNYSFSLNGMNQEGLFINDKLNRYGARLVLDTQINQHVKVGGSLNYTFSIRDCGSVQDGFLPGLEAWRVRPDSPVYDSIGNFARYDATPAYGMPVASPNPVAMRHLISNYKSYQFIGSAYIDVNVFKGFRLHGDINISTNNFDNSYFTPSSAQDEYYYTPSTAYIMEYDTKMTYTSLNLRANYDVNWKKNHLGMMLGAGSDRTFSDSRSLMASDFPVESILHNIGSANIFDSISDSYLRGGLNSIYSRFTYDYDQRYLAEVSFRADESSKFGPGNRWAYFPAVSLGWRAKNEGFLKDVDAVSDLKLRLSWGKTGSTNVADFSYLQYFSRNGRYGGDAAINLNSTLPNRDIKWEMTTEYNAGLDFAFLNNRIYGSLDIYHRYTDGSLAASPYLLESGMTNYYANLIDMTNQGIEFEVGADIIKTNDFTWSSSLNIASNHNKVKSLNGANLNTSMQDYIVEGEPAGVTKGYVVDRIINSQEDIDAVNNTAMENGHAYFQDYDTGLGDWLYKDTDGDGHITSSDRVVIANPQPKFFGGWQNTLRYKGLALSFLMQFKSGGEAIYGALSSDLYGILGQSITREVFGNTWTPGRTDAKYPRLVTARYSSFFSATNDHYVFDTSYLRMKIITLSYNLPKSVLNRLGLQDTQLYATVTNLFTITSWPGLDPELCGNGIYGMVNNDDPYPLSKTFTLGVNFKF